MRRLLRDGDSYKVFVHEDPSLHSFVRRVLEVLKPFGPCNVQLRLRAGIPYVLEFNARCSGTTYCRALAGFNEPLMTAELLLTGRTPNYEIRPITILRYWSELVVENDKIVELADRGEVRNDSARL
jgi:carbamoyl-phosphate synthase large subunit